MRTLLVIGIGAGDPRHLTLGAVDALRSADVVITLDKGEQKADLLRARHRVIDTHAPGTPVVTVSDPERDRRPSDYRAEVHRWHGERARRISAAITSATGAEGTVAFLVWGDPALYDSTLRIIDRMQEETGLECMVKVIPGITALQALTAAHTVTANRVGEPIHVTTGRLLPETSPADRRNCFVMLDGGTAWNDVAGPDTYIYWGAYLGTADQVLRAGYVENIGGEIAALKYTLRESHGWIMDTYLLRELDRE
ncbi:precorrin-6A synthase (deacetylating) [Corynebacterium sp. P7202]|uniref:Precorrin-6A synthase (Deacetylating) n=1 Tax=Corynebacterium pygosceleis TaxID=2800406 RepID=A0A9Q4GM18_9CORY|nr:precorrin-6A synthase (deacetylating) [Corynebacterium pygosceleis]MCK7638159.1 precorrin-6A synthase (deacetylating) [Corynebacterium pygosceleis]MCX7444286.1 precorrin-6A synthase (deacetylating) [Corynebacterium pygosceleis]MCX7468875.1 precorrin-6A synthase (deacetylating) [Corynebacterium pygosceleis]